MTCPLSAHVAFFSHRLAKRRRSRLLQPSAELAAIRSRLHLSLSLYQRLGLVSAACEGHSTPAPPVPSMGQSPSISSSSVELNRRDAPLPECLRLGSDLGMGLPPLPPEITVLWDLTDGALSVDGRVDYTDELPSKCLARVFYFLGSGDRKRCSLVCQRWLCVDVESRRRLSFDAQADLLNFIPSIFARFDSVSKLSLRCNRKSISINDDDLILISSKCPSLSCLKLWGCREITDLGIVAFA